MRDDPVDVAKEIVRALASKVVAFVVVLCDEREPDEVWDEGRVLSDNAVRLLLLGYRELDKRWGDHHSTLSHEVKLA